MLPMTILADGHAGRPRARVPQPATARCAASPSGLRHPRIDDAGSPENRPQPATPAGLGMPATPAGFGRPAVAGSR